MTRSRSGATPFVLGAAALGVLTIVSQVLWPLGLSDEAWFLQVAARTAEGEVLYRDVWAGVTPLSIWATTALVRVLGAELWVLRAFTGACFLAAAAGLYLVGRLLRASAGVRVASMLALFAFSPPGLFGTGSGYNPLVAAIAVWTLLAVLLAAEMDAEDLGRMAFIAGVLAGMCFATKQNVGLLIGAASAFSLWWTVQRRGSNRDALRGVGWLVVGFAAVAGVVVWASAAGAGLSAVFEAWFVKSGYLAHGGLGYVEGLRLVWDGAASDSALRGIGLRMSLAAFLLPVVGLGAPLAVYVRSRLPRAAIGCVFALCAVGLAYPRFDLAHLAVAAPLLLATTLIGWVELPSAPRRLLSVGVAVYASVAVMALLAGFGAERASGAMVASRLDHFGEATVSASTRKRLADATEQIRSAEQRGPIFILSSRAGAYYLATGLENPTPWDYPTGTVLVPRRQAAVRRGLESGRIAGVWVDRSILSTGGAEGLEELVGWVQAELEPASRTSAGYLFVPRSAESTPSP